MRKRKVKNPATTQRDMDVYSVMFRANMLLSNMEAMFNLGVSYSDAAYGGDEDRANDAVKEYRSILKGARSVGEDLAYHLRRANFRA